MDVREGQVVVHEIVEKGVKRGVQFKVKVGLSLGEEALDLFDDPKGDLRRSAGAGLVAMTGFHFAGGGGFGMVW